MKLNQELIERLADGEIAYHHTGTNKEGLEILKSAFPKDNNFKIREIYGLTLSFYRRSPQNHKICLGRNYVKNIEIFTTEQFYVQTMDDETRELAKRLFVALRTDPELDIIKAISISIEQAELFMKRLNAKS